MKQLLITIAALVLVGCGESQQSTPAPEAKPVEPVAEATKPESPTTKAPDISIHHAAGFGKIEAVKQHIAAGTDVNTLNESRFGQHRTPLHYAARWGQKEVVELLIAAGADVNVKFEDGKTALNWVSSRGEIADLLRKHGAKTGEELKTEGK